MLCMRMVSKIRLQSFSITQYIIFWRDRNCCELKTIFFGYHMGARSGVQDAGTNMEGTLRGWGGGGGRKAKGDVD